MSGERPAGPPLPGMSGPPLSAATGRSEPHTAGPAGPAGPADAAGLQARCRDLELLLDEARRMAADETARSFEELVMLRAENRSLRRAMGLPPPEERGRGSRS